MQDSNKHEHMGLVLLLNYFRILILSYRRDLEKFLEVMVLPLLGEATLKI